MTTHCHSRSEATGILNGALHVETGPLWLASLAFIAFVAFIALLGLLELLGLLGFLRASHAFTVMDMPSKRISVFGLFLIFNF
jgi:hypothetical protein